MITDFHYKYWEMNYTKYYSLQLKLNNLPIAITSYLRKFIVLDAQNISWIEKTSTEVSVIHFVFNHIFYIELNIKNYFPNLYLQEYFIYRMHQNMKQLMNWMKSLLHEKKKLNFGCEIWNDIYWNLITVSKVVLKKNMMNKQADEKKWSLFLL